MGQNPFVTDVSVSIDGAGVGAGLQSFEPPEPGQILDGRYELVSWVGEGTFGEVWKAFDLRLGITVAVKLAKSGAHTPRFSEEVELLAQLQHPGVVTLRDQWDPCLPGARPFFVMDYCASNLKQWIAETTDGAGCDLQSIRAIFLDVCRTVAFVHGRGTLHRDLKPSNILLLRDGDRLIPKLADFGEAGHIPDADKTATAGLGTAFYHSPEQGLLGKAQTPASDVFALAVVLYEMLTGAPTPEPERAWWRIVAGVSLSPAKNDANAQVLAVLHKALSATGLPGAAIQVIAQALDLDAENRPNALEFGTHFDRAITAEPAAARRLSSHTKAGARFGPAVLIPLSNAFGYLLAAGHPVLLDPKLTTRIGFGPRTYPHAWLILPLCAFVLIGTRAVFQYVDMPRRWWTALLPFLVAVVATIPILAPEVPHGALLGDTPVWLAFTGMWLAAHYAFNARPQANPEPYVTQSLRVLLGGALIAAGVAPIPIMLFLRDIYGYIVTDASEAMLLMNYSYFQVGIWELLWFVGPTRELGIAWLRTVMAAPPAR